MISDRLDGKDADDQRTEEDDPVLLMLGVGKQLWEAESGDSFIERLRSDAPAASPTTRVGRSSRGQQRSAS